MTSSRTALRERVVALSQARRAIEAGRVADAEQIVREELDRWPGNRDARQLLAEIQRSRGEVPGPGRGSAASTTSFGRAPSRTRAEAWSSFEQRVRERRVARCAERARTALAGGDSSAAQEAIDEIASLDPAHPVLATLPPPTVREANASGSSGASDETQRVASPEAAGLEAPPQSSGAGPPPIDGPRHVIEPPPPPPLQPRIPPHDPVGVHERASVSARGRSPQEPWLHPAGDVGLHVVDEVPLHADVPLDAFPWEAPDSAGQRPSQPPLRERGTRTLGVVLLTGSVLALSAWGGYAIFDRAGWRWPVTTANDTTSPDAATVAAPEASQAPPPAVTAPAPEHEASPLPGAAAQEEDRAAQQADRGDGSSPETGSAARPQPAPPSTSPSPGASQPATTAKSPGTSAPEPKSPVSATTPSPSPTPDRQASGAESSRSSGEPATSAPDRAAAPARSSEPEPTRSSEDRAPAEAAASQGPARTNVPAPAATAAPAPAATAAPAPAAAGTPGRPSPDDSSPAATAGTSATTAADDTEDVLTSPGDAQALRNLIEGYMIGYNNLDAGGVHSVWPSVDRRALARAFAQLRSQHIGFSRCEVRASGDETARGFCTGRAAWVPRVGSRSEHSEERVWRFEFDQRGNEWVIHKVSVER